MPPVSLDGLDMRLTAGKAVSIIEPGDAETPVVARARKCLADPSTPTTS